MEAFRGMKPEEWIDGTDFWVEGYGGLTMEGARVI